MTSNSLSILNLGLRVTTLGTRFIFIFFLARYLDPVSVGYYGVFTATIGYCLYFVGLDFYTYCTRELIKAGPELRGGLIKGQVVLSLLLYIPFLPAAYIITQYAGWPSSIVIWFLPILVFEHINQETYRILVALSEQLTASVILFIRQGSWAVGIVALMTWDAGSRDLQAVMASWTIAGALAAAVGVLKIRKLRMGGWRNKTDWRWIRRGIIVSAGFLVATLALRGILAIDRYWLLSLGGIEDVAAYVLLLGVASTLMAFLDAGLFAFAYPLLIKLNREGRHREARQRLWLLLLQTLAVCFAFALFSSAALPYLMDWISEPVYLKNIVMYPWVLLAMVLNAVSMVPHYALYAQGYDRPIIASHIAGAMAFVGCVWILAPRLSTMAVPIGLSVAFALILAWKTVALWISARNAAGQKSVPT